ncbi:MAG: glucose-6-phosphate isomerase [Dactylosporangium sp.]|nr:glucose-6-phosphate isomerase [Dactylosporangium sp.]NNJ63356.1 glucose-6-phosphate isomerase [Dactylosporangium sp.]
MTDLLNVEAAAGLTVYGAAAVDGANEARERLVAGGVPGLLAAKDPTLWGSAAEAESKIRLGWIDTFQRSRALLPQLVALRESTVAAGFDHVVLAGMGGSSLAPEVIARTLGVALTVLDTTDPHQIRAALADRLERTVVVVASKSGSTVETDSHRRAYQQAFIDAGITDVGSHFVVVTDPGSPLEATAGEMGAAVVLADPEVGGRFSALTAFGLVPSALIGVDVAELLDQAEAFAASLGRVADSPALALGTALGAAAASGRNKLAIVSDGTGIVGLGDWIEQLVAESTGKDGLGILPVVCETPASPGLRGEDVLTVSIGGSLPPDSVPGGGIAPDLAVNGPLGAQFLAWEYATAIVGCLIGISPFDQPNVAESKENTGRILAAGLPAEQPTFIEGAVEVYGGSATTLAGAIDELLGGIDERGYLAVMAYLDRIGDAALADVRSALAARTDWAVTFGWGPRFLHSTGQYHKGGPQDGSFFQITGAATADRAVPGRPYTFDRLLSAQAGGDREAIAGRGRPLLRLHLTDRAAGIAQVLAAAGCATT